jgi:hypothetical protein
MWERLVTAILLEAGHQQWLSATANRPPWCTRQGATRNVAPWERWLERRLRPLWGVDHNEEQAS